MSYSTLCKRVEDLEQEPELARELRKSLSVPGAASEVQLVTSCKSHKPPGAMKFRNIQCPTSCFCRSRNVVCKTTQRTIEAVPDSVPCTRDFIHNISALKALPEHYFVRLDIEEFFMSGDPEILACDAAGLSGEGPRKRPLRGVDLFLLTHQFVASKRHPERLW